MAEDAIHTRTFQVTVRFTDEERDRFLAKVSILPDVGCSPVISERISAEITANLESIGLNASVTIVERMEVG